MEHPDPPGGGERRHRPSESALDPLRGRWTDAHRDDLTGLYNRRLLSELFEEEWAAVVERHPRLSLVMLDLDGFKAVNDRHGHPSGDRVLSDTAALLRRHFREEDLIVRYGGDEFVVLAPGAGPETAEDLASRAREAMARFPFRDAEGAEIGSPLSFSLGVASLPADGPGAEELLAAADRRLYAEKRRRRGPRRLSRPAVVGAALVAGLVAGLVAFGLRWTPPPVAAPDPAATPTPPSALAAAVEATAGDSARLAAQVLALEQTVAALQRELERERTRPDDTSAPDAVRQLEDQVRALQAELESRAEATPTPAPTVEPDGAPAPEPVAEPEPAPPVPAAPVFERPRLLEMDRPAFPREAIRLRGDPVVRVLVIVDTEGRVVEARSLEPVVGYGLDIAALRAAETARFVPGTRDGRPIRTTAVLAIRFVRR